MLKILSSAVLGIEDATLPPQGGVSTMYLGPNPAGTSTTLNWQGTGEMELEVSVFDLSGRVVMERTLPPALEPLTSWDFPREPILSMPRPRETSGRQPGW